MGPFIATRSMASVAMDVMVPMRTLRYMGLYSDQLMMTVRFSCGQESKEEKNIIMIDWK